MSVTFMWVMALLNVGAGMSLIIDGKFALGICFLSYAVAGSAMVWVVK